MFEADPPENTRDLLADGKIMCDSLAMFRRLGKKFWSNVSESELADIEYTIESYRNILLPPKISFGLGWCCPCLLKLKRSGLEYEKQLLTVHATVIGTGYTIRLQIIESEVDKMLMESLKFNEYVQKMNGMFDDV